MINDGGKSDKLSNESDLYKKILTSANKLETLQSNLESVIDCFLTPLVKLYNKLSNDCLKLFFEYEFKLDHYRKAEELIWRRIYHDIYRFQKQNKQKNKSFKKHEQHLLESHFISGIGFYSSLIIKLRYCYKIYNVHGIIEPLGMTLGPIDNFHFYEKLNNDDDADNNDHIDDDSIGNNEVSMELDHEDNSQAKEWARQAIYRSLVYMGDLARYLLETSQFDCRKLAFEFYLSASRNQPDYGLPFNQLATLASSANNNLDAVCNYMRCCLKSKPFEGAEGNMKKLFDLNNKFYEELKFDNIKIAAVYSSKDPSEAAESMVRAIIITFIKLTSNLWLALGDGELQKEVILEETRLFFEILNEGLELEPIVPLELSIDQHVEEFRPISGGTSNIEKQKFVTPTLMYEFCCISIMLITKCQKRQHNVDLIDLVNTLALNLLHYSTLKCRKMIMSKLQQLRVARLNSNSYIDKTAALEEANIVNKILENSRGNLSNCSQKSTDTVNSTGVDASTKRLRQKKAATNYLDARPNPNKPKPVLTHHNDDSDMSELEETALSTIDALDISSEMSSGGEYRINDLIDLDSSSDEMSKFNHKLGISSNLSKPILRPTKSQNYEHQRSRYMATNTPNSLPMPDLLTGDVQMNQASRVYFKPSTSQSPIKEHSKDPMEENIKKVASLFNSVCDEDGPSEFDAAMAHIYSHTYLPIVKIFCDWLLSNGQIISLNLQSFNSFLIELEELVKYLKDMRKLADTRDTSSANLNDLTGSHSTGSSQVYTHVFDGPSWIQKYPLSCDFPLYKLSPLKSVHETNINFDYYEELDKSESGFITVQCIEAFFYALSAFLENKPVNVLYGN